MSWDRPQQGSGNLSPAQASSVHPPVRVATQVPIAGVVGTAPLNVDGVVLAVDDRVLRTRDGAANGIYRVVVPGGGANGTWIRDTDYDTALESENTVILFVQEGATDANSYYRLDTDPPIVLGVTALVFTKLVFDGDLTVRVVAGSSTALATDAYVQFTATGVFTLAAAPTPGKALYLKRDYAGLDYTISGNGNTIDGDTQLLLPSEHTSVVIIYNGAGDWSVF